MSLLKSALIVVLFGVLLVSAALSAKTCEYYIMIDTLVDANFSQEKTGHYEIDFEEWLNINNCENAVELMENDKIENAKEAIDIVQIDQLIKLVLADKDKTDPKLLCTMHVNKDATDCDYLVDNYAIDYVCLTTDRCDNPDSKEGL